MGDNAEDGCGRVVGKGNFGETGPSVVFARFRWWCMILEHASNKYEQVTSYLVYLFQFLIKT